MIKTACSYCGKEININKYKMKNSKNHFCCQKCYGMSKRLVHKYIEKENHVEFALKNYTIIFDKEDFEKIRKYSWTLFPQPNNIYCRATTGELMHRVVMDCLNTNLQVDHISHNTLDNRKKNLKICNCAANQKNKLLQKSYTQTKYTYITKDDRWKTTTYKVRITHDNKRCYLGQYPSLEEAINVRDNFFKRT